jgi:hypothetical protein
VKILVLFSSMGLRDIGHVSIQMALVLAMYCQWMYGIMQVVDYIVDPFVAGTSGADPDSLSVSYL